jgi:hypothetical protein
MKSARWRRWLFVLGLVWVAATALSAYRWLAADARIAGEAAAPHAAVLPVDCARARGGENRDFVREDADPERCWVDLASFHRLYPEIAQHTDEAASVSLNLRQEVPDARARRRERVEAATLGVGVAALLMLAVGLGLLLRRRRPRALRAA